MPEENLILKLFDTLKDAITNMNDTLKELLNNQKNIADYMKTLPIKDLKESLKDHSKESTDNIDECTQTVELQSGDILKAINNLKDIITKTIVIVGVFFTIVTSGWFYKAFLQGPTYVDNMLQDTISELKKTLEDEKTKNDNAIKNQNKIIEELRTTIRNLKRAEQ